MDIILKGICITVSKIQKYAYMVLIASPPKQKRSCLMRIIRGLPTIFVTNVTRFNLCVHAYLKIYLRKFYGQYNDILQHYNTPQFHNFFVTYSSVDVCLHTPGLTSAAKTGYTPDSTTGAWPYHVKFTPIGHLFTHLGFPECPCSLECIYVTCIPGFVIIMD